MMENKVKKIVFISPQLSQPRCIRRVHALKDAGFEVKVYGYGRGIYDCNSYSKEIQVIQLGILQSGSGYLFKVKTFFCDVRRILKENNSNDTILYAFGIFPAIFFSLFGTRYIYEISDIAYANQKFKRLQPFLKIVDIVLIKRAIGTVLTSMGFLKFYKLDPKKNKIITIPNKVSSYFAETKREHFEKKTSLSFGFVGLVRYKTVFNFAEAIGKYFPNYSFHFYGEGSPENLEVCSLLSKTYKNVFSHGAYKNPEELEKIYSNIDVVVACYDTRTLNVCLAEPNKLYEALFFCKPIVVSKDTFLSEQVEKFECGFCIDALSVDEISNFLKKISIDDVYRISVSEYERDRKYMLDNYDDLLKLLNGLNE